ncbi:MAG: hypothetical protein ACK5LN_15050 [Propioniciclava sp.]
MSPATLRTVTTAHIQQLQEKGMIVDAQQSHFVKEVAVRLVRQHWAATHGALPGLSSPISAELATDISTLMHDSRFDKQLRQAGALIDAVMTALRKQLVNRAPAARPRQFSGRVCTWAGTQVADSAIPSPGECTTFATQLIDAFLSGPRRLTPDAFQSRYSPPTTNGGSKSALSISIGIHPVGSPWVQICGLPS